MTSPPYNIGLNYETQEELTDYINKFDPLIAELVRILADDGSICWQVGNCVDNDEIYPLDIFFYPIFKKYGLKLRNRIIWRYESGLNNKNRFSGRYETLLWFTRSNNYVFNLDPVRIPSKYPGKKAYKGKNKGKIISNPLGKNPGDVWELTINKLEEDWDSLVWNIPTVKHNHPEKGNHPCQFPVELVERCVLALTNEGDIVFDPFAGVGSTIIGAIKNTRIGIGCDTEQLFVTNGLQRIQELEAGTLKLRPMYQEVHQPKYKNNDIEVKKIDE